MRCRTYTRQRNQGVSWRVIAKWMRLASVDHERLDGQEEIEILFATFQAEQAFGDTRI
jgi:ribulose 1,5-bisphosphate carboxylase large subunit-like protein